MSIKKEDYLCLSAMLRAREQKLLSYDRACAMTEAPSFEDAAKQLSECGYPDMTQMNASEICEALAEHRAEIFGETDRLTPDSEIVNAFRMKYDYHNIKAIIKSEASGLDPRGLLTGAGRFPAEKLLSDYNEEQLSDYPGIFAASVRRAADVLASTANPQLSDIELDRAYFQELNAAAEALKSDFFADYVKVMIDSANLRTAVRVLRMGKGGGFLEEVLVPGGTVPAEKLASADRAETLAELYANGALSGAAALAQEAAEGSGMTEFEKACDNAVNTYLKKARYVTYGPEPVIAYLASVEAEITAARMILTGRLSNVAGGVIKERLRDMYA